MDRVFPLDLPIATQTYLVLYLVTLTVHFVLASYVVAGSLWLTADRMFGRRRVNERSGNLIPVTLSDWLPFALGVAITAGVAPLLFIQILYKQSFYTANLLLFHRWMLILPILIVGFYILYLGKTTRMASWPRNVQFAVRLVALGCVLFTGWSWTENHLLSVDSEVWPTFYASSQLLYKHTSLLPRCAVWVGASIPTMAMILAWQLRERAVREKLDIARDVHLLAVVAMCGLILTAVCLAWYRSVLPLECRDMLHKPIAAPYPWIAAAALALQGAGWLAVIVSRKLPAAALGAISPGVVMFVASVCVLREVLRLGTNDLTALTDLHERAAHVGGLGTFLIFFVLNVAAITVCVVLVRRGIRAKATNTNPSDP